MELILCYHHGMELAPLGVAYAISWLPQPTLMSLYLGVASYGVASLKEKDDFAEMAYLFSGGVIAGYAIYFSTVRLIQWITTPTIRDLTLAAAGLGFGLPMGLEVMRGESSLSVVRPHLTTKVRDFEGQPFVETEASVEIDSKPLNETDDEEELVTAFLCYAHAGGQQVWFSYFGATSADGFGRRVLEGCRQKEIGSVEKMREKHPGFYCGSRSEEESVVLLAALPQILGPTIEPPAPAPIPPANRYWKYSYYLLYALQLGAAFSSEAMIGASLYYMIHRLNLFSKRSLWAAQTNVLASRNPQQRAEHFAHASLERKLQVIAIELLLTQLGSVGLFIAGMRLAEEGSTLREAGRQ